MRLELFDYRVRQKRPFKVSRETYSYQDCVIAALSDGVHIGYGEATAFRVYGATSANIRAALEPLVPVLADYAFEYPAQLWRDVAPHLSESPFAQCALDVAAHDLWGKREGRPLYELLELDPGSAPPSEYSFGMDPVDHLEERVAAMSDWPVFKIKLGGEDDLERVRRLRRHTRAAFKVDANCGWTVEETLHKAEVLKTLGVTSIEQPLPPEDLAGMARLRQSCPLPLIADESCTGLASLETCAAHFHGINSKLMKCGGITPFLEMVAAARALGLQVHAGCMPETSIGIAALANVASLLDAVDADSILLIANDLAEGVAIERGRISLSGRPGCGVEVDREQLARDRPQS